MENNEEFKLSKEELDSPLWKKLEWFAKHKLDAYRKNNDIALGMDGTHFIRGKIDMCKQILELNPENEGI